MADFNAVANEVFQVLRSFDYTVRLYDENGMTVMEPDKARRFMAYPHNLLVSLTDDDDNSRVTLSMGKSTHINDVMGLNQQLRTLATKYNMIFRTQQYGKVIGPKNFSELATVTEREEGRMQVCEGMYGTSRSSYLRLENARMIVRHNKRIDDSRIGARGRCVESVFVENAAGERTLMPTNNLMAGRAMTQHINQGGKIGDPIAQQINTMSTDYGHLATGAQAAISESAGIVREACRGKMGKLRKTFERLYNPSSYPTAISELQSQATVLNETDEPITDVRLDEMRGLLGSGLPQEVYECACKAMDEMAVQEHSAPTISVLGGRQVNKAAWDEFRSRHIPLRNMPDFTHIETSGRHPRSSLEEIIFRLHELAQAVSDDSLANLFDYVAQKLPDSHDPNRAKYMQLAVAALNAVNGMPHGLARRNESVSEHMQWLSQFEPNLILSEVHGSSMDPYFPHDEHDEAVNNAIANFDPEMFVDSPEMQDVLGGRDPHDPDENTLTRDEITQALDAYLAHHVEAQNEYFSDGFDDTSGMADAVYGQAAEALHQRGYVVQEAGLQEDASEELTIEDVLLPKANKGADLGGDVTKQDIVDPAHPDEHENPNTAYTSRLMTLAGMQQPGTY